MREGWMNTLGIRSHGAAGHLCQLLVEIVWTMRCVHWRREKSIRLGVMLLHPGQHPKNASQRTLKVWIVSHGGKAGTIIDRPDQTDPIDLWREPRNNAIHQPLTAQIKQSFVFAHTAAFPAG